MSIMKNKPYKNILLVLATLFLLSIFVISCADKEGVTYQAIFDSIKDNKVLVLKAILDKKELDINYVDEYVTTTALNEAVFYADKEVIDLVISYGADVNAQSYSGKSALMIAAANNSVDILNRLLFLGADIDAVDRRNYNALMYAAESGSYYACQYLFGMGINSDVVSIDEQTALDIAIANNYEPIVSLLTKSYSPLIDAVIKKNNRLALQIISTEDNLDVIDSNGLTALMHATESDNVQIVRALLSSKKIDVDKKDKSGTTALSLAVELDNVSVVELLLKNNAKTDIQSMPVIFKAKTPRMLRLLASHGVDINKRYGDFEYTPLMIAAENYSLDMVKTLIELGADRYAKNKGGSNALMLAKKSGNSSVVNYLSSSE